VKNRFHLDHHHHHHHHADWKRVSRTLQQLRGGASSGSGTSVVGGVGVTAVVVLVYHQNPAHHPAEAQAAQAAAA